MTFDEWVDIAYAKYKDNLSLELDIAAIKGGMIRQAWDAAINEAQQIAWEYARGIRKGTHIGTLCDDVAESIRKLESSTQ